MKDLSSVRQNLESGREQSGLGIHDLWLECLGMGFAGSVEKLQEILDGTEALSRRDYDLIAQCLNERLRDLEMDTLVPHADEIDL